MACSIPSLLVGVLLASSCWGVLGACGSFSTDTTGDGTDAAAPGAVGPGEAGPGLEAGVDDSAVPGVFEVAKGIDTPTRISADASHLYVTTQGTPATVLQLANDGSTSMPFASGLDPISDISVGPVYVHWTTDAAIWTRSVAAAGAASAALVSSRPTALATREGGSVVYGTEGSATSTAGLIGASSTFDSMSLLAALPGIASLAAAGDAVIFIGVAPATGGEGLRRYDFGSPNLSPLPTSADTFGAVTAIAADGARIVFAEATGAVHELKTADFTMAGAARTLDSSSEAVVGIVLDDARHRSYWLTADGLVHRHEWASEKVSVEGHGCRTPGGIAQDKAKLYWTCPAKGTIEALAK